MTKEEDNTHGWSGAPKYEYQKGLNEFYYIHTYKFPFALIFSKRTPLLYEKKVVSGLYFAFIESFPPKAFNIHVYIFRMMH